MTKPAPRLYARGNTSRTPGTMNKTEARRAEALELRKRAGLLHDYAFEAVKLRLADNTFLTLDFLLIASDGTVELEDVKGRKGDSYYTTEDARVKIKVAARMYPWFRIATVWEDKAGDWKREEINP